MERKKEKQKALLLMIGIFLMNIAPFLNKFVLIPDFFKGLIYGIGFALVILFIAKNQKTKNVSL